MAKVLCIIALAGLTTAAPYAVGRRAGTNVDADAIVNRVMGSIDIDGAIAEAMRGLSGSGSTFTGTLTRRPQVTVRTSGSRIGENSQSQFSGISTQGGSSFTLQSRGGGASSRSDKKTAIVGQVMTALNPQIEKAVANALQALSSSSSSTFGTSNQQSSSFGTSSQQSSSIGATGQTSFSSGSSQIRGSGQDESALVSQIISMLTPSITQSVQSALSGQSSAAGQQSFTSAAGQQSFTGSSSLTSGSSSGFSSGSSSLSSGSSSGFSSGVQQTISSQKGVQNSLALKVLAALQPTITAEVQAAIASMMSSSQSSSSQSNSQSFQQAQAVQVSEQEVSSLVRQIITTLTPSIRSSVQAALRSQANTVTTVSVQPGSSVTFGSSGSSQTSSSSSSVDQRTLVTRIMSILQPQIMSAVSDAIAAQEAAAARAAAAAAAEAQRRQAALREQQQQAALREQQRLAALREQQILEQRRQAAFLEQQRIEQQRQAALLEQQKQAALLEQQRQAALLEQQRQQALLAAQQSSSVSGNLSDLFGSGHEVVHEIANQARVEYNIGAGGAGVRRTTSF